MLTFYIELGFNRNNKQIQWFQVAYSNRLVLDTEFSILDWSVGRGDNPPPPIAWGISKILEKLVVEETKTFMVMNFKFL